MEFLADDRLGGRQPGTAGYDLAARYVAEQFRNLGVSPAAPGDGWFQPVPLRSASRVEGSDTAAVIQRGRRIELDFPADFFRRPDLLLEQSRLRAAMVFVAYGVDAPALGYSDYTDVDVRGKVVVMLAGTPAALDGDAAGYFGTEQAKLEAAARHGAAGVVFVFTPLNEAVTAWDDIQAMTTAPAIGAINGNGRVTGTVPGLHSATTISHHAAGPLFDGSGHELTDILALDREGGRVPVFGLDGEIKLAQASRHDAIHSANVVGMVPGTDPLLARDLVVYVAHLDHIGVRPIDGEPVVHNGALDNAVGVAVMLDVARRFVKQPSRRTVVFLATTAEEAGLVGADWYARQPLPAGHRPVAVINIDMPVLLFDFTEAVAWGGERSSLGDAFAVAAAESGISVADDPFPGLNIFTRSDHYAFVRQGVPALMLGPAPGPDGGDNAIRFDRFLAESYHRPSDRPGIGIDYAAADRFARLAFRTGEVVAGQSARPRWRAGDFFGETFSR
ncbi:M28 family peptidase [Marinihelvus fidelis]|uniref:M28 family peptidase n=1 Tax=Marinihelvus fidelis TaxID=2613842 RepID=A0A5N0TE82_9GAMM|nr:M28 family peptidase [Marinihelvus fidelis]KAA9131609.1 M28 family peptidase [Marinihelvus fidelis]